jgi:hypothetical protein
LEVASKVVVVLVTEVAVTDTVDIVHVADAFDVNLVLVDQFLKLVFRGGHQPWPVADLWQCIVVVFCWLLHVVM